MVSKAFKLMEATHRRRDPFSGVDSSVVQHSRLSRSATTPKMKSIDVSLLIRLSRRDQLRIVREQSLQISKVVDVVLVVVVLVKPSIIISLTLPLLGRRGFGRDGSSEILVQDAILEAKAFKLVEVIGGNDNVNVLEAVLPLVMSDSCELLLYGLAAVSVYTKDLVSIIGLDLWLGGCESSKSEGKQRNNRAPHGDENEWLDECLQ